MGGESKRLTMFFPKDEATRFYSSASDMTRRDIPIETPLIDARYYHDGYYKLSYPIIATKIIESSINNHYCPG
jgi:hypothetical protein